MKKPLGIILALVAIVGIILGIVGLTGKANLQKELDSVKADLEAKVQTAKDEGAAALEAAKTEAQNALDKLTAEKDEVIANLTAEIEALKTPAEPEVTEPEVTEPEVTEPEVTEPEVTEPEVTEPEVTEPEVTEPEVTEPEVTEPEVTEPEVGAVPEGYPAIIEGLDFGGATIYIYDWWSNDDESHSARTSEPDEDTAKLYAYRDWLEQTYNCKIVETALSDWAGNPSELANMVMNGDNSKLCLVAVASDFAGTPLANDLYMPWQIDLSGEKWNKAASDFCTKDGVVYGVHVGKTEPRSCVYFNKRVLKEAGVDPESIYDAQANGTWTWDMMLEIMEKVQRDTDNDGIYDVYGMVGSGDELAIGLMFSNNASFFDYDENGKLVITSNRQEALDALQMRKTMAENYMAPQPEGSNWDWFKDYWKQGTTAFYPGQTWQGFNDGAEMADMADEWGCVMFPKGPHAETYLAMACDNIYGIPNVYDAETSLKIQQIYDLYTNDTPGVDTENGWIGNKYLYTDSRAVDETYAMMREDEHSVANKTYLLGSTNDVLGAALLWGPIGSMTPAEAVESATPVWQDMLDVFNGDKTQEQVDAEKAEREAAAAAAAAEAAALEAAENGEDAPVDDAPAADAPAEGEAAPADGANE